jgi:hypothetical protein
VKFQARRAAALAPLGYSVKDFFLEKLGFT